jgi:type I restriction enzyme M protein
VRGILADPGQVAGNLRAWIAAFDADTRDVIEKFDFDAQIGRLDRAKLLYLVLSKVTEVDLHPDKVSNVEMGYIRGWEGSTTKIERRTDGLAFGRIGGRKTLDGLPARLPSDEGRTAGVAAPGFQGLPHLRSWLASPSRSTGGMLSVKEDDSAYRVTRCGYTRLAIDSL